jgi:hypothetical protein
MVNAIVLLKVKRGKINQVAHALADLEGISEVYSVPMEYSCSSARSALYSISPCFYS